MMSAISVLYVEDDPMSRRVMQLMFTMEMGLQHITIFENSSNFMERVESITPPPNIIFLDIHVLPHDGFAMLKMLRQSTCFQKTPIVALTASVMNEEINQLRVAGFDGCLAKPIDGETFADLFQDILNGREIWRITY
jgi:CheY-like chemotaxis protein